MVNLFPNFRLMNEDLDIGQSATLTDLAMCINHYRLSTPGLYVCVHIPVQLDAETRLTPGIVAQVNSGRFKQCEPGDYSHFTGPPNFVLDVFKEGEQEKYQNRREPYEQAGVLECVAWIGQSKNSLVWNRLIDGAYQEVEADDEGLIKSSALPGLWMPLDAVTQRDWWRVMATISRGITRQEHHAFMGSIWKT